MFFLFKLFCAVIFPPMVLWFISDKTKNETNATFMIIVGWLAGWLPGTICAIYYIIDDALPEPEDDTTEGTETQLVPQQSTSDAVQNKVEDRLSKLKQMLEQGIITEEEYTKKRSKIIDDI